MFNLFEHFEKKNQNHFMMKDMRLFPKPIETESHDQYLTYI